MIYPPTKRETEAPRRPLLESWYHSSLSKDAPRGGINARTAETPVGHAISANSPGAEWRHPWFTRLSWEPSKKAWVATVHPGFVNGYCPIVLTTVTEAQSYAEDDYGINPLTGQPYFSDPIFKKPQQGNDPKTQTIAIPLYMRPAITIQWENLGWDGKEGFPDFFKNRGVNVPPPNAGLVLDGEPVNTSDSTPPPGNRLLRAADLILHQPRVALTSSITLEPGIVTGLSNALQTLGIRDPAPGDALKVFCGKIVDQNASGIDPLAGDYEEPTYDEILISTVYLLSPPDAEPYSQPDSSWTPYVRHNLFWNLTHVVPVFEAIAQDISNAFASLTSIATILGGGTASFGVNFTAAGLNDIARNALNMILAHSLAGSFYTATSGGTFSTFPDLTTNPSADVGGLAKSQRQAAQRKAKALSQVREKLDPSFPYNGIQFPTQFLI